MLIRTGRASDQPSLLVPLPNDQQADVAAEILVVRPRAIGISGQKLELQLPMITYTPAELQHSIASRIDTTMSRPALASRRQQTSLEHIQQFSKSRGRSVAEFARNFGSDRSKALAASATKKSKML